MTKESEIKMDFNEPVTGAAGSVTNQNNHVTQIIYPVRKAFQKFKNFAGEMGNSIPYFLNQYLQNLPEESEEEKEKRLVNSLLEREIQRSESQEVNLQAHTKYLNEILPLEQAKLEEEKRHNQFSEEIALHKLHLQYIELKFKIEQGEKELKLKEKELEINKNKINLEEKRLEIELQRLELMREWQRKKLKSKSDEIQALWDAKKSSLILSPQETKSFFLEDHKDCDLFIFFAPLEISEDSELSKSSINEDLENDLEHCLNEFYGNSQLGGQTQFYRIFDKPIVKLEAENFIKKFYPIPIIIFYGNITNSKIFVKMSFLQKSTSIELNWRQLHGELGSLGFFTTNTIENVKDILLDFYKIAVMYIIDLYYLYVKDFHEIRLPQMVDSLLSTTSYHLLINKICEHYIQDLIDIQNKRNSLAYYQTGHKYYQAALQARNSDLLIEKTLFEKALLFIEESVKFKSDYSEAWYLKGIIEFKIKRYISTIESCNQAIEIDLTHAKAWLYKAKAFEKIAQQQGNYNKLDEAINCYKIAIDLQPQLEEALEEQGLLLYQINNYKEAIIILNRYTDINPRNEVVWFAKGRILLYLKLYRESAQSFQKVIEINRNNYNAWLLKGKAALKIWDVETAIYSFSEAIKINPKILNIILQSILIYSKKRLNKLLHMIQVYISKINLCCNTRLRK